MAALRQATRPTAPAPRVPPARAGTVLDTESLVLEVAKAVVARHGKMLTQQAAVKAVGLRPLEAWQAVREELGLPEQVTAQALFEESEPLLRERWKEAPLLPGVLRLLSHFREAGLPMALATSSSRATLALKLSSKQEVAAAFAATCCGDEVCLGKPHPECFLEVRPQFQIIRLQQSWMRQLWQQGAAVSRVMRSKRDAVLNSLWPWPPAGGQAAGRGTRGVPCD